MRDNLIREFWVSISLVGAGALIGAVSGYFLPCLALALTAALLLQLYKLRKLVYWLENPNPPDPYRATGVWRDIHDHVNRLKARNRERKLRLSEMLLQFQASAAAIPDAAVSLGDGWTIQWFNDAAKRLLALDAKRDKGERLTNLFRSPQLADYLSLGEFDGSLELPAPGRSELKLSIRVVPYADNQWLLLAQDVTERFRLERVRKDFVANVSHELRTPLTVLTGFIENMQQDEVGHSGQWSRPITLMAQQLARMRTIVEDLLLLARLEGGEAVRDDRCLDVGKLATELVEVASNTRREGQSVELQVTTQTGLIGDEQQIRSAFQNLITNAVNYTPEGGKITVAWRMQGERGVFEVTDTGEGIAADHLPRVTERFYRIDKARSRQTGGTGLGLAIVKHVLQLHDAELRIDSEPGVGSRFSCWFPAHRLRHAAKDNVVSLQVV